MKENAEAAVMYAELREAVVEYLQLHDSGPMDLNRRRFLRNKMRIASGAPTASPFKDRRKFARTSRKFE